MNRTHNLAAITLTCLMGVSAIAAPLAATASQEGKRNTTYALGAAAAALLLTQHNKLPGLLAAGGAAYAYTQIDTNRRSRYRSDNDGYRGSDRNYRRNDGDQYNKDRQPEQSNENRDYHNRENSSDRHDNSHH